MVICAENATVKIHGAAYPGAERQGQAGDLGSACRHIISDCTFTFSPAFLSLQTDRVIAVRFGSPGIVVHVEFMWILVTAGPARHMPDQYRRADLRGGTGMADARYREELPGVGKALAARIGSHLVVHDDAPLFRKIAWSRFVRRAPFREAQQGSRSQAGFSRL
jgi:hypothetical protein